MFGWIKNLFGSGDGKTGYKNLSDEDFQAMLKSTPKSMILDVRSKKEFDEEKIPNAFNLDIMHPNFKEKVGQFDSRKTYFVYCLSGGRSARACRILARQGFENVYNLKGGIRGYTGKTV